MLIRVTQEHIDHGKPCQSQHCMIALAILAAMPGLHWVYVTQTGVRLMRAWDSSIEVFVLPPDAREQIRRYDDWRDIGPFEFELYLDIVTPTAACAA